MSEIKIRKATIEDLEPTFQLKLEAKKEEMQFNPNMKPIEEVRSHYHLYLKRDIESKYRAVLVAVSGKEVVGMIIGRIYRSLKTLGYERRASMGNLYVRDDSRGKGIAKKLIQSFFDWARSEDIKTISLSVYPENKSVMELYKKQGFDEFCATMHKKL